MRTEVKDFMRMCERLLSLAMTTGELSDDECGVIAYYTQELHDKTLPICERKQVCEPDTSSVS